MRPSNSHYPPAAPKAGVALQGWCWFLGCSIRCRWRRGQRFLRVAAARAAAAAYYLFPGSLGEMIRVG